MSEDYEEAFEDVSYTPSIAGHGSINLAGVDSACDKFFKRTGTGIMSSKDYFRAQCRGHWRAIRARKKKLEEMDGEESVID